MTTFTARGGLIDCRFARDPGAATYIFAGVTALAEHIHDLRGDRPIFLRRLRAAGDSWVVEVIVVHWADEEGAGEAPLGYTVIGSPPLNGSVQYELLGAALAQSMPVSQAA